MVVVGAHFLLRCLDLERFVLHVVKVIMQLKLKLPNRTSAATDSSCVMSCTNVNLSSCVCLGSPGLQLFADNSMIRTRKLDQLDHSIRFYVLSAFLTWVISSYTCAIAAASSSSTQDNIDAINCRVCLNDKHTWRQLIQAIMLF